MRWRVDLPPTIQLITAPLDLQLVRLIRGAMNAEGVGRDGRPIPRLRHEPEPRFLPRPVVHPAPRFEPRPVIRPEPAVAPLPVPAAPAPLQPIEGPQPPELFLPLPPPWKCGCTRLPGTCRCGR